MKYVLTLSVLFWLSIVPVLAIKPVEPVMIRGTLYYITDVKTHTHTHKYWGRKIYTLNTVEIDKEGKQHDGLPIDVKWVDLSAEDKKKIHDFRPLQQRRPLIYYGVYNFPGWAWNIASTFR